MLCCSNTNIIPVVLGATFLFSRVLQDSKYGLLSASAAHRWIKVFSRNDSQVDMGEIKERLKDKVVNPVRKRINDTTKEAKRTIVDGRNSRADAPELNRCDIAPTCACGMQVPFFDFSVPANPPRFEQNTPRFRNVTLQSLQDTCGRSGLQGREHGVDDQARREGGRVTPL